MTTTVNINNMLATWNDAGTDFVGIFKNITDTASGAGSKLLDLQRNSATEFSVFKDAGIGLSGKTSLGGKTISLVNWTIFYNGPAPGGFAAGISTTGRFSLINSGSIEFASFAGSSTISVALRRDADGVLALRNGANEQALRVYNFGDTVNGEFLEFGFQGNADVAEISTKAVGTGTARPLSLISGVNGANSFRLTAAGEQIAQAGRSNASDAQLRLSNAKYGLTFGAFSTGNATSGLREMAAGVIRPHDGSGGGGALGFMERASDPPAPGEGHSVIWQSDGTGSGDDGDIMVSITAGGVTKTATLVDFSALP